MRRLCSPEKYQGIVGVVFGTELRERPNAFKVRAAEEGAGCKCSRVAGGETSGRRRAGHFHGTGESPAVLSRQGSSQQPRGLFTSKSINIKCNVKFNFSATLAPFQWPHVTSGCHVGQSR